jgi:molybdopterin/thiamine biosynthesis adenylyltransferase
MTPNGKGSHVVVVGAGGNIGSHLVPHLARMDAIGRLTLIDRDTYEPRNVANQAITRRAMLRSKAAVQSRVARAINPGLHVDALSADVESLPLGALRGDLILACLDTRRARQYLNEAALHLGVPWIDAGVLADAHLARIEAFTTGPGTPCLECRWEDGDYAALEQSYSCDAAATTAAPTGASSALGALAAALQAMECQKHLRGGADDTRLAPGDQVVVAAANHQYIRTRHRRNPSCRVREHDAWNVEPFAVKLRRTTLGTFVRYFEARLGSRDGVTLSVRGHLLATELLCTACGAATPTLRVATRGRDSLPACPRCGESTVAPGFGLTADVRSNGLMSRELGQTLAVVGLRPREIVRLASRTDEVHVELHQNGSPARARRVRERAHDA